MIGCRGIVVLVVLSMFVSGVGAALALFDEKDHPEPPLTEANLIGVWEAKKELPPGSTIEFRKKGKMTITVKPPKMSAVPLEGTYKIVPGKKIEMVSFDANGERSGETWKMKVFTKKRLVFADKKGKELELTRKK
jgi:uncharacterized protein (TIGR03066 family)